MTVKNFIQHWVPENPFFIQQLKLELSEDLTIALYSAIWGERHISTW